MKILKEIIQQKDNRKQLIKEFQKIIFDDENASEYLLELAYDLEFYEPSEQLRKQDFTYYGDDRLEEEIKMVLLKLEFDNK